MSDSDKQWMKPLVIAVIIAYAAGKIIYEVTGILGFAEGSFGALREFFIPVAIVIALLIVLYLHNRQV